MEVKKNLVNKCQLQLRNENPDEIGIDSNLFSCYHTPNRVSLKCWRNEAIRANL